MIIRRLFPALVALALTAACTEARPDPGGDGGQTTTAGAAGDTAAADDGLVTVPSPHGVDETFGRLEDAIEGNENLTLLATVDHAANAAGVGLELPAARLLIFGNPRLGTPLMRAARTVAIDLPQKLLVWENDRGQAFVTYNRPAYLARRHGIVGHDELLATIAGPLDRLATGATAVTP